jgi:hypothetical protein
LPHTRRSLPRSRVKANQQSFKMGKEKKHINLVVIGHVGE